MFQLGMLGFADNFRESFSIALKSRARDLYALVPVEQAQILLVDTDNAPEQDYLQAHSGHRIPMVAVSSTPGEGGDGHRLFEAVVSKPVQFSALLDRLNGAVSKHYPDHCSPISPDSSRSSAASVPASSTAAARQIKRERRTAAGIERASDVVEADKFLLGSILKADRSATSPGRYFVRWQGGGWLAIDWRSRVVSMSMSRKILRSIVLVPREKLGLSFSVLAESEFDGLRSAMVDQMDLEEFLWFLTYWTVRSDRLDVLDLNTVFRLRHWPNLTRYSVSDMDIPLASYWVTHPSSVSELLARLNMPADKVLPFAACCFVAGLLEATGSLQTEAEHASPARSSRLQGVLSAMLGRFSRGH